MVDDRTPFVLTLVLTLVGLGITLYGVTLNAGAALNPPMLVGGAVMLLGVGVLTQWIIVLDDGHGAETDGHA